jgi:uncharacterized SAM-binding protein YcdF (DUF218 family)
VIILSIIGISSFLSPDDTAQCKDQISGTYPCQVVDAIVAVSGGDTNARTDEAITLYKNGWANKLVFSGAAQDKTGISNAAAMRLRAIRAGVSENAIHIDEYSENTRQNAENTNSIFKTLDVKDAILVTSGYHQRRASIEFKKRTSVNIINHPVTNDKDWSAWWWATPHGWVLSIGELAKIIGSNFGVGR